MLENLNYYLDIRINNIYSIVKKTEKNGFYFQNNGRLADGFVYFIDGEGLYLDNQGVTHNIGKGCIVFLQKGDCYKFEFNNTCTYITAAFDCEIINSNIRNIPHVYNCSVGDSEQLDIISKIFKQQTPNCYTECRIKLLQFYLNILNSSANNSFNELNESVQRVLPFIHKYYNRNFSTEELSELCDISPSYLRRCFKKVFNCSITEYRERLRIENAKNLLTNGEFTIKEIAELLGYSDVYHFTKKFKKSEGIPPGKFKKNI